VPSNDYAPARKNPPGSNPAVQDAVHMNPILQSKPRWFRAEFSDDEGPIASLRKSAANAQAVGAILAQLD